MSKVAKGLLGVIGLGTAKPPKADVAPAQATIAEEDTKAKRARAAQFETPGGVLGEELDSSQVSRRPTLFGN